jgi:hypothetical protein
VAQGFKKLIEERPLKAASIALVFAVLLPALLVSGSMSLINRFRLPAIPERPASDDALSAVAAIYEDHARGFWLTHMFSRADAIQRRQSIGEEVERRELADWQTVHATGPATAQQCLDYLKSLTEVLARTRTPVGKAAAAEHLASLKRLFAEKHLPEYLKAEEARLENLSRTEIGAVFEDAWRALPLIGEEHGDALRACFVRASERTLLEHRGMPLEEGTRSVVEYGKWLEATFKGAAVSQAHGNAMASLTQRLTEAVDGVLVGREPWESSHTTRLRDCIALIEQIEVTPGTLMRRAADKLFEREAADWDRLKLERHDVHRFVSCYRQLWAMLPEGVHPRKSLWKLAGKLLEGAAVTISIKQARTPKHGMDSMEALFEIGIGAEEWKTEVAQPSRYENGIAIYKDRSITGISMALDTRASIKWLELDDIFDDTLLIWHVDAVGVPTQQGAGDTSLECGVRFSDRDLEEAVSGKRRK